MTACENLVIHLSELFECSLTTSGHTRIRTPLYYPDGGIVDVFLVTNSEPPSVTDFGEAVGWLRSQSVSGKRSPKQNKLVQDICTTHGVEFYRGQLTVRVPDPQRPAAAVLQVAQAAVRVADLWFTMRTRAVESTEDEVADFFTERRIDFERSPKLPGRSGRTWTPSFHTRTPRKSHLVYVLSTGSRGAAKRTSEHVVAAWHDLSHMKIGPSALEFVSLFDDTSDVWTDEDFKLVESVSEIVRWSRPEEVEELLTAT